LLALPLTLRQPLAIVQPQGQRFLIISHFQLFVKAFLNKKFLNFFPETS
jgi:hypothetical protein